MTCPSGHYNGALPYGAANVVYDDTDSGYGDIAYGALSGYNSGDWFNGVPSYNASRPATESELLLFDAGYGIEIQRIPAMKVFNAGQQIDVPGLVRIDRASATTTYIGEAAPGSADDDAAWQIKRITFDVAGNPVAVEWVENNGIARWDQRAVLSYQ